MDEMDVPQLKKEVESLKYQLAFKREKSSKTVTESVAFDKIDQVERIERTQTMESFEGEYQDFELNTSIDGQPVKLLKYSLVKWIEDGVPTDPFLNPELMKNNPWVEKGKCVII